MTIKCAFRQNVLESIEYPSELTFALKNGKEFGKMKNEKEFGKMKNGKEFGKMKGSFEPLNKYVGRGS